MDEKIKELRSKISFLTQEEIERQVSLNKESIENNIDIDAIVDSICKDKGIDIKKINGTANEKVGKSLNTFINLFSIKEIRKSLIIDVVVNVLIILLLKLPFDFVRDLGYDYLDALSSNQLLYSLWNILFLIVYTVVLVFLVIFTIRRINNKYNK